jgi:hypothetical protein
MDGKACNNIPEAVNKLAFSATCESSFGIIKQLLPSCEVNIKLSTLERLSSLGLKTSGKQPPSG